MLLARFQTHQFLFVGTISDTSISLSISVLLAPFHVECTAVQISISFHFESRLARLLLTPSQFPGSMSGNKNTPGSGRGGTRSNAAAAEPYVSRHFLFPSIFLCVSCSFFGIHQCCFTVSMPLWLDSDRPRSRTTPAAETTSGAAANAAALQFAAVVPGTMPAVAASRLG